MSFDWNSATVGDFVDLQRGNTYQSALLDTPGPVLLGLASIERDGGFRSDKLRTYGGESPAKLLVYPGDMYVSLKDVTQSGDLLGSVARVPSFIAVGRMTQDTVKLVFKNELIDRSYLYWVLRTPEYREYCRARGMGTTNLSLSRDDFLSFPIPEPTSARLSIQRTLDAIEGKITLNRDIAQTLEAMAQAIFKSWFVDFDPVKARIAAIQEGRDPLRAAMSAISGKADAELDVLPPKQYDQLAAIAALFPDEMEESELGETPRGWTPAALSTVCDLNASSWGAKTLPASVNYVDLANTKNGAIIEVQAMEGPNIPSRARRILESGDTIVGTVRPGNRSFALVGEAGLTGSTGFAVLHPKKDFLREYVYLAATADANIERLTHLADGGAYPAVRPELVVSDSLPIPNDELLRAFHRISSSMFNQILGGRRANQNLTKLRDTLLPKLLSGELSVTEAMVEAEA